MPIESTSRGWITWRSILIGSIGAAGLCALVPYNDYVVANTYMVGTYMPPILVLMMLVVIGVINAPLNKWAPAHALSRGELGTILAMLLAACSIPSQGLMRSFIPNMAWPFHFGETDPAWWKAFSSLGLPGWLFPTGRAGGDPSSLISQYFYSSIPHDSTMPIPYRAWMGPILAWGIFFVAMIATLVALAVLVLPQWATNERLPFPLAQVQISLIEAPQPGKAFNAVLGSPLFWIAVIGVCLLQGATGMHQYFPTFPRIPIDYDLTSIFKEPWSAASIYVRRNSIFFTFVGVTYFIQARMAFSLWFIYLVEQLLNIWLRFYSIDTVARGAPDQQLGACAAYVIGAIWIGRHHWAMVIKASFGRGTIRPELQRFASARLALFVAIGGIAVMMGWLIFLGVHVQVAAIIVAMILIVHAATARVVCETGLPCYRPQIKSMQIFTALPVGFSSTRDIYFSGVFDATGTFTARESQMTFSLMAMRDNDTTALPPRQGRGILALMVWAMVLGFFASGWSSLHSYYSNGKPLSPTMTIQRINPFSLDEQPTNYVIDPVIDRAKGRWPARSTNPWAHFAAGAGITVVLQIASAQISGWPLMPVGFVVSRSNYMDIAWFSVFLGWLAKTTIVRFGGVRLYGKLRPLFIGLICGECLSTGIWLVVSLLLASSGHDYRYVNFLPD